jgi:hypothetical protein
MTRPIVLGILRAPLQQGLVELSVYNLRLLLNRQGTGETRETGGQIKPA